MIDLNSSMERVDMERVDRVSTWALEKEMEDRESVKISKEWISFL